MFISSNLVKVLPKPVNVENTLWLCITFPTGATKSNRCHITEPNWKHFEPRCEGLKFRLLWNLFFNSISAIVKVFARCYRCSGLAPVHAAGGSNSGVKM